MSKQPKSTPGADPHKVIEERVIRVLNDEIRPVIQQDGGDITYVGMDGYKVQVQLQGACVGCPGSIYTLQMGVERYIKKMIPEVEAVVAV